MAELEDPRGRQGVEHPFLSIVMMAILAVIRDEKQSIYGFRRADIQVFQQWRNRLSNTIPLSTSFRTHEPLIKNINQIFAPILTDLHKSLDANRIEPPHPGPHEVVIK